MSTNQPKPVQPTLTPAMLFLLHLALSFGVGAGVAVLTAIYSYFTTGGNFNLPLIATLSYGVFAGFFVSFFRKDILPNQAIIVQGIRDEVATLHNPLISQIESLAEAVLAMQQTVAATSIPAMPVVPIAPLASTTNAIPSLTVTSSVQQPSPLDFTQPIAAIQTAEQAKQ